MAPFKTPDRAPGPSDEEELILEDRTADGNPTVNGAIRFVGDDFVGKTSTGTKSLTTGGGISASQHRNLDQLVHDIAETSYEEYVYTGNRVDAIIIWTSSGKTQKIRETLFTYTGNKVTTIVSKQYDGAGSLIAGETMTKTLNYTGNQLDDVDVVVS